MSGFRLDLHGTDKDVAGTEGGSDELVSEGTSAKKRPTAAAAATASKKRGGGSGKRGK